MIYHITTKKEWDRAVKNGFYQALSLRKEGFIHLSSGGQVHGVLSRYYAGQTNLVLLHVDETKLTHTLKYEIAPSVNELFPHLFGALNIDAVVNVEPL